MTESNINALLDELATLIENSKPTLTKSNIKQVDSDEALAIIDEIQDILPSDLKNAKEIVAHRAQILADAQRQADVMISDAKAQARTIASEQQITILAQKNAAKIMTDAQNMERKTRDAADEYARSVFEHVSQTLGTLMHDANAAQAHIDKGHA